MKQEDPQQPGAGPARERLDSWKEIASYLKREVRTVQRWEKSEGLPVRRHLHKRQGTVYAYKSELDAWWRQRGVRVPPSVEEELEPAAGAAEASESLPVVVPEPDSVVPWAATGHWLPRMTTAPHALAVLLLIGAVSVLFHMATTGDDAEISAVRTPVVAFPVAAEPQNPARTSIAEDGAQQMEASPVNPPSHASTQTQEQPPAQAQKQPPAPPAAEPGQSENQKAQPGWLESLAAQIARGSRKAISDTASLWNGNVNAGHPMAAMVRWNGSNGHVSRFLDSGGLDHGPQFSPDGRRLVFASDRSGSREIWVADASGQRLVRLTSMGVHLTGTPRWSPDGLWIVFDSYPDGNGDIFIVNASGGEVRRVTSAPSAEAVPSWSRDGRWVYFASDRTGEWQVWKQQVMGGAEVQVTRRGGFAAFESYDGKWLFYARHDAPGLWKVPVEGGEEVRVLDQLAAGLWGYWALAANGVYFAEIDAPVKGPEGARTRIRFLSLASRALSTVAELEGHPVEWDPGLAVSPNGQAILYAHLREADPGTD